MRAPKNERKWALAVLFPSMVFIFIFVYAFVGNTAYDSLTDWGKSMSLAENPETTFIGFDNYQELFTAGYWDIFRQSIVNAIFYWIFILSLSLLVGFGLAVLLDHNPRGENVYRTIFLYPFALSFIVTGTIWRWLCLPNGGINLLPTFLGLPKLPFEWMSDRTSVLQFDWSSLPLVIAIVCLAVFLFLFIRSLRNKDRKKATIHGAISGVLLLYAGLIFWITPPILDYEEMHGLNLATFGVILAAVWQYSGYAMALYLAGLRGLPEGLYEAAKLDGASDFTYYVKIALPNLWPITLSAVIVLTHISLKIFALIFAMAGIDNSGPTHPAVLLYSESFRGNNFAIGSAIAMVLFVLASLFIIPYLIHLYRQRKGVTS
ncbi:MAG TPA: sugar ABC transporter permease [Spirochaetia bacterium]|nr:sugar ABC transporter permease [Spirochaetia bacterium]